GIVAVLLLLGALLSLLSTFGILRLPDIYNRSHAATVVATVGAMSILLGLFLYFWLINGVVSVKVLLGMLFLLVTLPIGGHMMGRAAYSTNVPLWERTIQDALACEQAENVQSKSEMGNKAGHS